MRARQAAIDRAESVFHALGDPTRRAIVQDLCRRPATVTELATTLSVTRTAIGQHVSVLEECGLVRSSKVGRVRTCSFNPRALDDLQGWIDFNRATWRSSLDRLGDLLDED